MINARSHLHSDDFTFRFDELKAVQVEGGTGKTEDSDESDNEFDD